MAELKKNIPLLRFKGFNNEWENKPLKDTLNLITRPLKMDDNETYSLVTVKRRYEGIIHRGNYKGKEVKVKSQFLLKENDFLISKRQISHNACGIVPRELNDSIVSNEYSVFTPQKNLNIHYFNYFCHQAKVSKTFFSSSVGVHIEKMLFKVDVWLKNRFYFPSIQEQQKIASFLSAVDDKIQQLTRKKKLLKQYKKGVMQQLFSGKLRFKDENGKVYPQWQEKKLGDIGETYHGLTGKTKENFGEGKPYIQYKQILDNSIIDIKKCGLVRIKHNENQQKVKFGDVFFTISSETPNEIGFTSVLLDNVDEMYLNSFCFGYRPNSIKELIPQFARYLFRNEKFRRTIIKLAQGSTRYNMSKVELMKLTITLPAPAEQQKIASFLTAIDAKIETVNSQIIQTQTFKKGLLQQMFV